jgi:hypothetical protein
MGVRDASSAKYMCAVKCASQHLKNGCLVCSDKNCTSNIVYMCQMCVVRLVLLLTVISFTSTLCVYTHD